MEEYGFVLVASIQHAIKLIPVVHGWKVRTWSKCSFSARIPLHRHISRNWYLIIWTSTLLTPCYICSHRISRLHISWEPTLGKLPNLLEGTREGVPFHIYTFMCLSLCQKQGLLLQNIVMTTEHVHEFCKEKTFIECHLHCQIRVPTGGMKTMTWKR